MPHPESLLSLLRHRRPLLLQGPMGPFFAKLARFLEAHGQQVRKLNFNGGDQLFFRGAEAYTGSLPDWPAWLADYLRQHRIDAIVLFGQSRPMHEAARAVAEGLGIEVYVFEEGYLRPDYVTLEPGGVNGYTRLPRDPAAYAELPASPPPLPRPTSPRFRWLAFYAMVYVLAMTAWMPRFRAHVYHRPMNPVVQAACWVRGGTRKLVYGLVERRALAELTQQVPTRPWFLFPLQVHNDAQLLHHSPFRDMASAIEAVVTSFATAAPPDTDLVIKHHPMDRPYTDYRRLIADLARRHGAEGRLRYVHDLHLPTLLKQAVGVVTVNSTVGLQSLFHGTPVHALGDAIYAMPGLVHQGALAAFWTEPGRVDAALFARFRRHLVSHTQLNASFHGEACALDIPAALQPSEADHADAAQDDFSDSLLAP